MNIAYNGFSIVRTNLLWSEIVSKVATWLLLKCQILRVVYIVLQSFLNLFELLDLQDKLLVVYVNHAFKIYVTIPSLCSLLAIFDSRVVYAYRRFDYWYVLSH